MITIALLAGEVSGDSLGATLMKALKQRHKNLRFIGIGGEKMQAQGIENLADINELSLMGLDVLFQLPSLLKLRRKVIQQLKQHRPQILIGIDAPDFNLKIERALKREGTLVWHWVSPSIWAWRKWRIPYIGTCCDEVLCLFPREPSYYKDKGINANFYGHPMADEIPIEPTFSKAFERLSDRYSILKIWKDQPLIALLPGSRKGEIKKTLPLFFSVATKLIEEDSKRRFILPIANQFLADQITSLHDQLPEPIREKILLIETQARDCIRLAQFVLLVPGTAALETMLLKKPMLIAHQSSHINCLVLKIFLQTPYVSLPNFLADDMMIDELLCHSATQDKVFLNASQKLNQPKDEFLIKQFESFHRQLAVNCVDQIADKAIAHLSTH